MECDEIPIWSPAGVCLWHPTFIQSILIIFALRVVDLVLSIYLSTTRIESECSTYDFFPNNLDISNLEK